MGLDLYVGTGAECQRLGVCFLYTMEDGGENRIGFIYLKDLSNALQRLRMNGPVEIGAAGSVWVECFVLNTWALAFKAYLQEKGVDWRRDMDDRTIPEWIKLNIGQSDDRYSSFDCCFVGFSAVLKE